MTEVIDCGGLDDLDADDLARLPPGVRLAVYAYSTYDWGGCGDLLLVMEDGRLLWQDLGHCSCYGPAGLGANWADLRETTPAELSARLSRYAYDYDPEASSVGQEVEECSFKMLARLRELGVVP